MKTAADILAMLAAKAPESQRSARHDLSSMLGKIAGASISAGLPGEVVAMVLMDVAVMVARLHACDDTAVLAMFDTAKHVEDTVQSKRSAVSS